MLKAPIFRWATVLIAFGTLAAPLALYSLLLISPYFSGLGQSLRYDFNAILFLAAGLLALAFLPKGRIGCLTGLTATLALFGFPLKGLWDNALGEMHVLGGLIFFSDTAGYYWDANRLLEDGLFSAFAARRPLFAGFLAGLLGLTRHNLQLALAILVALVALASFLATREVRRSHGPLAAAFFLLLLFLFYRRFTGMTDTENLGLALGAVAFALLWRAAGARQGRLGLLGIFALSLALFVRNGAVLVLPALVLWAAGPGTAVFAPKPEKQWKSALFSAGQVTGVILLAFLANLLIFGVTSDGRGSPFANSAYIFYGMASGGQGWEQVYRDYPELTRLPEAQAARAIDDLAWQMIRHDPRPFIGAVANQFGGYFSLRDESLFGFASGADLVIFDSPKPENAPLYHAVRLALLALSLVGLVGAFRRRSLTNSLLLFSAAGLALSSALIPPRDAGLMRVFAATMPFLCILPAAGFADLAALLLPRRWRGTQPATRIPASPDPASWALPVFSVAFISLVILSPLAVLYLAHLAPEQLAALPAACLAGEQTVTVRISPGAYLRVISNADQPRAGLPEIRQSDFRRSLDAFPHRAEIAAFGDLPAPALLQNALDLRTGNGFWLVYKGGSPPSKSEVVTLCGHWSPDFKQPDYNIFIAIAVEG